MPSAHLAAHREWLWEGRDLELQDPVSHLVLDGDWRTHAQNIRRDLDGFTGRLGIHGPFWGLTVMAQDPAVRRLTSARLRGGLAMASEIGATHMVVHSPFDFFGHPLVAHTGVTGLDDQLEQVHETLREVVDEARQIGCMLVIENIRDLNPAPLLALVSSFDSGTVQISIDVGHAALMQAKGGPSPDHWIREAGRRLGHVHLQDTDGLLDRHWKPGDGSINWRMVFRALREVQADPRLILELKPEEITAGQQWLVQEGLAR
ncbi:sugar phosphate isomerase/epimerase family protein [Deinococcus deserti]|nr:sugar phosphate isomerase/epimerase [Deinococcus deserti]